MRNLQTYEDFILESKQESYWDKDNEVLKNKTLWKSKNLEVGKTAKFKTEDGKMIDVELDVPSRGGDKKFQVYHNSGKTDEDGNPIAQKIEWGDATGLSIKNDKPSSAASYWARHQCDLKKKMDPTKPGFWACYAPSLFAKELDLISDKPW